MTRRGFTLIELLMSVIITAIMMTVCFITFNTSIRCWSRSAAVADSVRNAEYALTQVVSGLRSAYYPTTGKQDFAYGFQLYDNGEDPEDSDTIQWVKLGTSIVGNRSQLSETPHTVRVWVQKEGRDGPGGLWVKAGRLDLLADDPDVEVDFNDDEQFEPYPLIEGVQGFDCKVQSKPDSVDGDGTPKWEDTWDTSNSIPYRVKLTFWMTPAKETGEPVPIMRVVEIPLWDISQNPVTVSSEEDGKGANKGGKTSGGGATGGGAGGSGTGGGAAGGGGAGGRGTGGGGMSAGGRGTGGGGMSGGGRGTGGGGMSGGGGRAGGGMSGGGMPGMGGGLPGGAP